MKRVVLLTIITIALYSCNSASSPVTIDSTSTPTSKTKTTEKMALPASGNPQADADAKMTSSGPIVSTNVGAVAYDGNKIFPMVEVEPEPIGGLQKFYDFFGKKIVYPKDAKEAGTTGKVIISFVVERDGSLTNIQVLREPGNGLGAEATRVLKIAPKWKPGIQEGRPVRTQYTIPVNFSLGDQN